MNIGFDLDKIFVDYPPLIPDRIIDRLYKKKSNGMLAYRTPSGPEKVIRILSHHYLLRPPITDNIEFVESIAKKNKNKYYLISSRFSFLKIQTEKIVDKYNFDKIFNNMFFNYDDLQPHIFKDRVIKKMNIDLYVDDDLPLLKHLSKNNKKPVFFWKNKNKSKKLKKNLYAIKNLSEMFS